MQKYNNSNYIKLDYSLQSPMERKALVEKIIDSLTPEQLTPRYLQILADYILFAMTKQEKKQYKINTENRMVTINKHETSLQGLISKFQQGEDGIYNLIIENDKNIIFTPKKQITQKDIESIPFLKQLRSAIDDVEQMASKATGKKRFLLKKQLIQMRQDQYVIKNAYNQPIFLNGVKSFNTLNFDENIYINSKRELVDKSLISFMNPKHISALLCNYSKLKQNTYGRFYTDGYYLIQDLEDLIEKTLAKNFPVYYSLLIYKIDGKTNLQIQKLLQEEHNTFHTIEYISALWRRKIPKLLAKQAEKDYLTWYYTIKEKGKWKKCSRCNQIKLANNLFFSKNSSSKDGFYSICKECRNLKKKSSKNTHIKIIKRIPYKREDQNGGERKTNLF